MCIFFLFFCIWTFCSRLFHFFWMISGSKCGITSSSRLVSSVLR
jgi:hypothetical protein